MDIPFIVWSTTWFVMSSILFEKFVLSETPVSEAYFSAVDNVLSIIALPSSDFAAAIAFSRARLMLLEVALALARKKTLSDIPLSEQGMLAFAGIVASFAMFLPLLQEAIRQALMIMMAISQNNFITQIYKNMTLCRNFVRINLY